MSTRSSGDEHSELGALRAVCAALGGVHIEHTGHDSAEPDGLIRLPDGSEADLEVYREVISEFRQATAELERMEQVRPLSKGMGTWVALFPPEVRLKEIAAFSDEELQLALETALMGPSRRSPVSQVTFAGYGGTVLMHLSGDEDTLSIGVTTAERIRSTFISTHPDSIATFAAEEVVSKSEKIGRLVRRAYEHGRKAHVAVVVEESERTGMHLALFGVGAHRDVKIPGVQVELPPGLDGFWVVRRDYEVALGFVRDAGWMRYEETLA